MRVGKGWKYKLGACSWPADGVFFYEKQHYLPDKCLRKFIERKSIWTLTFSNVKFVALILNLVGKHVLNTDLAKKKNL